MSSEEKAKEQDAEKKEEKPEEKKDEAKAEVKAEAKPPEAKPEARPEAKAEAKPEAGAERKYHYPNKWGRVILTSADDVMGEKGVSALLNMSGLQEYIGNYPPDNMKKEFSFEHVGKLQQGFWDMYGNRMDSRGKNTVVKAQVPMSEMLNYQSTLNSITAARGSFHMQFSHYDPVPGQLAQKIVQQAKDEGRIRVAEERS